MVRLDYGFVISNDIENYETPMGAGNETNGNTVNDNEMENIVAVETIGSWHDCRMFLFL